MMLLNVFYKPLHIPELFKWVLIIGVFIPLGLTFYFIKKQKQERQGIPVIAGAEACPTTDSPKKIKRRLVLLMLLGCLVGLCSPLWLPLTGNTLGIRGDFIVGLITATFTCIIFGLKLRKI